MPTLPISVTILTKNSRKYLTEVLAPLALFDEVLVCDTGSCDDTLEITKKYPNVTLVERPFIGFGPTHNVASSLARNDWILSIDSDEVVTQELLLELRALKLKRGIVYSIPRKNLYRGKWIRWCGWYPDRQRRLYNRLETAFSEALVHESIELKNSQECPLKAPLIHYSYADVSDFLAKMQAYSDLFAKQNVGKKRASLLLAIGHGLAAFFKSYLLKRGFLGRREGFEISLYNANTAFYKYLKLADENAIAEKCACDPMKREGGAARR